MSQIKTLYLISHTLPHHQKALHLDMVVDKKAKVEPEGIADIQLKRAADGQGLIVRAFNLTNQSQTLALQFPATPPTQAWLCSPIEETGATLPITNQTLSLSLPPRSLSCARVTFAPNQE